jgi:hypothetical protein
LLRSGRSLADMADKGWLRKFDDPIETLDGTRLNSGLSDCPPSSALPSSALKTALGKATAPIVARMSTRFDPRRVISITSLGSAPRASKTRAAAASGVAVRSMMTAPSGGQTRKMLRFSISAISMAHDAVPFALRRARSMRQQKPRPGALPEIRFPDSACSC